MINFTKGSWAYDPKNGIIHSAGDKDNFIASVYGYDVPFAPEFFQSIANSRLIASAPDMFYALQYILDYGLSLDTCIHVRSIIDYIECNDIDENDEDDLLKYGNSYAD